MQNSVGQQNLSNNRYQTIPPQNCQCPVVQYNGTTQPVQQSQSVSGQNVAVPNYSGVNIQIFNPTVTPPGATAPVYNVNSPNYNTNPSNGCYPSGYYTNNWGQNSVQNNSANSNNPANSNNLSNSNSSQSTTTNKKTEKREIVQLTDEYIKNLENYLNSQDKEVRLMGAKEVVARLEEDQERKDDKALNALVNKMLQDPYTPIRVLAMSALNSRAATGDDLTVNILQQMQNSPSGYGQDGLQASEILLKMSGPKVEKEFEVKNTTQKTETKNESKSESKS